MSKVIDTTFIENSEYLLSQTPPNFVKDNYYLHELQEKVCADWRFRPNRKWIEQELEPGTEEYTPIDVVVQTVHSEKGEKISNDWYKLVFKDCLQHNRLGKRYRFSYTFDPEEPDSEKNIWIGMNQNSMTPTSSQVICRCNGTIGSIYTDEDGKNHIHYEPVIQPSTLTSAMFQFNEVAIDTRGQMILIAQHNKYTEQYYVNQRFVIGYDRVYKVNNIAKSDALKTYDPHDVGIIRIYLDQDQIGDHDDFVTRIAYNGRKDEPVTPIESGEYTLEISEPKNIPDFLTEEGFMFKPQVLLGDVPQSIEVNVTGELSGPYAARADFEDFCEIEDLGDGGYKIHRINENAGLSVTVKCSAVAGGEELNLQFVMQLRDF